MARPEAGGREANGAGPLAARLSAALAAATGPLLVVTGAGASLASGIPTFRGSDPGAVWTQDDMAMAKRATFERDPVGQWQWYLRRFSRLEKARPNAGHRAIVALERWQEARGGQFQLVTQNIDTLHEQAGSRRLIKVHGSSDRLRCSRYGCRNGSPRGSLPRSQSDLEAFQADPCRRTLPACPACGALLRAHVLFFDEMYDEHVDYRFDEVRRAADEAELMIFVGTSFSVGVTELLVSAAARRGVPRLSIDPGATRQPGWTGIQTLAAPAEDLLPEACRLLGAGA